MRRSSISGLALVSCKLVIAGVGPGGHEDLAKSRGKLPFLTCRSCLESANSVESRARLDRYALE